MSDEDKLMFNQCSKTAFTKILNPLNHSEGSLLRVSGGKLRILSVHVDHLTILINGQCLEKRIRLGLTWWWTSEIRYWLTRDAYAPAKQYLCHELRRTNHILLST